MTRALKDWLEQADRMEEAAKSARAEADKQPSISVADLVRWNRRLIMHDGETYEVTARKLEITKRATL